MLKLDMKGKINKFAIKQLLKKYTRLFYKEFNKKPDILTNIERNEISDFILVEMKKEYIIKNSKCIKKGDSGYLDRREIILNSKINILEKQNVDYTYITALFPSIVTLIIFATNVINTGYSNAIKTNVDLYGKHIAKEQLHTVLNVVNETTKTMADSTGKMIFSFMFVLFGLSAILEFIKLMYKQSNEFKNEFNKMCLSVITQIKSSNEKR